ncbi:hypothetical protein DM47_2936 [Burkholderia mallei]|nr:hypothetical protein DM75_3895 [Burkholderia mallei]KOT19672.1 hypothetical protein DM47_2936 [Burkholderia mallei]
MLGLPDTIDQSVGRLDGASAHLPLSAACTVGRARREPSRNRFHCVRSVQARLRRCTTGPSLGYPHG